MTETPAQRALTAASLALTVAIAAIVMFLPPLSAATQSSVLRAAATALVLGVAVVLHWVFVGIAAHRLQRSLRFWVGLAVLLFPIGSAAALILLSWFTGEGASPAPAPAPGRG
jgi:hypothetical protein